MEKDTIQPERVTDKRIFRQQAVYVEPSHIYGRQQHNRRRCRKFFSSDDQGVNHRRLAVYHNTQHRLSVVNFLRQTSQKNLILNQAT